MKHSKKSFVALLIVVLVNIFAVTSYATEKKIYVTARSAIAMDCDSNVVLFEQNAKEIIPMASTTKIMTVLVAIKNGDLDREITISKKAARINGSEVGYKEGEKIKLRELLYGLMLRSGNDASIAIAEGVAGSVDEFLVLMNEYATEVGLRDTHFETPHGLDKDYHYTTAYDLALLTCKAKQNKLFNEIVSTKDIGAEKYGFTRSYHNINKILYKIGEANGVKTGYTGKAGKCLVSSVRYDDHNIVIVTLNCADRYNQTQKIFSHVKKNFSYEKIISKDEILNEIEVNKGKEVIEIVSPKDVVLPLHKDKKYRVNIVEPNYEINNPIKKNTSIGMAEVVELNDNEDKVIYKVETVANNDVGNENNIINKLRKKFFHK